MTQSERTQGLTQPQIEIDETAGMLAYEDGLIACFTDGTLIRTETGEERVEQLQKGHRLRLWSGEVAQVRVVLKRYLSRDDLDRHPELRPVRITAGALGQGLPKRDLLVSPHHRMLVASPVAARMFGEGEVLIAAIRLTELPGIYVDQGVDSVTYVNVALDRHQVIFAEGCPSETLYTGPEALARLPDAARQELLTLFPDLAIRSTPGAVARKIPAGQQQKQLVARMSKNAKRALDPKVVTVPSHAACTVSAGARFRQLLSAGSAHLS